MMRAHTAGHWRQWSPIYNCTVQNSVPRNASHVTSRKGQLPDEDQLFRSQICVLQNKKKFQF